MTSEPDGIDWHATGFSTYLAVCQGMSVNDQRNRGRPPIRTDDEILRASLRSFAAVGFEAMSVRSLSTDLDLSHETIRQRFGSKRELYFAAADLGIAEFFATIAEVRAAEPAELDDIDELEVTIRSFLIAASRHPEIGRLVNHEGLEASERLEHLMRNAFEPGAEVLIALIVRLVERGEIRPTTARELFFLGQAGAAPFNLPQLSAAFDDIDGPFDPAPHIEGVTQIIMRGIRRDCE